MGDSCVTTSPSGRRTAVHTLCGARIITPSMTACPPIKGSSPLSSTGMSCRWVATRQNWWIRLRSIISLLSGSGGLLAESVC